MNQKHLIFIAAAMLLAVSAFVSIGCNMPGAPAAELDSGASRAANYTQCWKNDSGGGSISCSRNGETYTANWSNVGNIVAGIGYNPCNGANMVWSGSCNGCKYWGVYGWNTNPLVEYYIGRGGGSSAGSYSTSRGSYTLNSYNCNGPNITGNGSFQQWNASGASGSPINLNEHFNGWRNLGKSIGGQNYCMMVGEDWSQGSGNFSITLGGGGGSGGSGGSGGTGGSGGSSGSKTIIVRARGTSGQEQIRVTVNGTQYGGWTLGTGMANWQCTTSASGGLNVQFTNDGTNKDVQVDYVSINGSVRQAESQGTNTGVYQNGKCGGSNSEWMHCNGYIGFGNI